MRARLHPLALWLRSFLPVPLAAGRRELWLGCLGVGIGLLCTEWLGRLWLGESNPWFLAPMGASAVLAFMVPASPLAQPWSVVGGNLVSALVGVALYHGLGESPALAGLAGAAAVAAMVVLRCLHPPGGAMALTTVLGGPAIHQMDWGFALGPVLTNALCLAATAVVFNHLTGRRYPHHGAPHPHRTDDPLPTHRTGMQPADLDAALASYGEPLDIDREDLEEIMVRAQLHAQRRHWDGVLCEHIMSHDVVCVGPDDRVDEAWHRLATHKVKALPVTDADGRLVGIVSLHDFFIGQSAPVPQRPPLMTTARRVHEIMSPRVVTARPEQAMADLVQGFSDGGLHHMPVVDAQDRVVGMITQSDLLAALFKNAAAGAAPR
ncbi:MAG: HPP family protein [Burkholderiaceae bacterium]